MDGAGIYCKCGSGNINKSKEETIEEETIKKDSKVYYSSSVSDLHQTSCFVQNKKIQKIQKHTNTQNNTKQHKTTQNNTYAYLRSVVGNLVAVMLGYVGEICPTINFDGLSNTIF